MPKGWIAPRIVAVLGLLLTLAWLVEHALPFEPRQDRGLVTVSVLLVLAAVAARWPMRDGLARLRRNPDLLVPLGCLMLALWALARVVELAALGGTVHEELWVLEVGKVVVSITIYLLLMIAVFVAYAAWVTTLMLHATQADTSGIAAAHTPFRRFLRTLGAMTLGIVVLLGALVVVLAVLDLGGGRTATVVLTVLFLGVPAVLWNLATAALLPVVLHSGEPLGAALKRGIAVSWRHKRRWWVVILVHMLLLGVFVYVDVSFDMHEVVTERASDGTQSTTTQTSHIQRDKWSVSAFWTGAYEAKTRWYPVHMEVLETPVNGLLAQMLWIAFSVLAIVVKLTIIGRWREVEAP